MHTRRRFFVMLLLMALAAVGTVIYTQIVDKTCTVKMLQSGFGDASVSAEDFRVVFDDPSVAELTRLRMVDNDVFGKTPEVTFRALKQGDTTVHIYKLYTENGEEKSIALAPETGLHLHVSRFGNIVETNTLTFNGWQLVQYEILVGLLVVSVFMLISFFECMRKGRFSYSMVGFGGVAMYCAFMLLLSLYDMQWMNTFRNFLFNISDTGLWFVLLTTPFMLLLAGAIAFSNIWLLRHEGFRPQNMLGVALAVAWLMGIIAVFVVDTILHGVDYQVSRDVSYSLAYVLSFMECMLVSTIVCTFLVTRFKPPFDKQYVLILGCCIRDDGTLTPILKGRADAAIDFERRQFAVTGKHAKFVPSGGQGDDEVISESEAIKRYLMEQGYPEEQIIKEDKSVNTFQNIQFSRDKIEADAGTLTDVKAAFATTNYHVFRGYILSRKHKLDAQGISAKTKWYFYPNAFLREFVGLLYEKKFSILVMILLILLSYTAGVHLLEIR